MLELESAYVKEFCLNNFLKII